MTKSHQYIYKAPVEFLRRTRKLIVLCEHRSDVDQLLTFLVQINPYCDGVIIVDSSVRDDDIAPSVSLSSKLLLYIRSLSTEYSRNIFLHALLENHIKTDWILFLYSNEIPVPVLPVWDIDFLQTEPAATLAVTFIQTIDQSFYCLSNDSDLDFRHEARLFRLKDFCNPDISSANGYHNPRLSGLLFCQVIDSSEPIDSKFNLFTPVRRLDEIYRSGDHFMNFYDLSEFDLVPAIKNVVNRIANYYVAGNPVISNFGLYTGTAGITLLMAQLYLYTQEDLYFQKMNAFLDQTLNHITTHAEVSPTFCDGLAGFGWLISYLTEKDLIETEQSCLDLLDDSLRMHMRNLAEYDMFDTMHGMLGVARYFLCRRSMGDIHYALNQVIAKVDQGVDGELLWPVHSRHKAASYDFGLAHGTAGVLYFIDQCYNLHIEPELSRQLGDGLVRFYLLNEQSIDQVGSYYPYSIYCDEYCEKRDIPPVISRLAWCYGDLSALFVIYRHTILTKNTTWQKTVLNKLISTTYRRNLKQVNICDAQFCHGSSGLVHMYCRLYHQTRRPEFRDAAMYWLKVTLQMQTPESNTDSLFVRSLDNPTQIPSDSLLEGSAGIGLALLSALGNKNMDWDEAMMLS